MKIQGLIFHLVSRIENLVKEESLIMNMFSCSVCNREFFNRNARDGHKRNICTLSVILKKSNGEEQMIQKMNGNFTCLCGTSMSRPDNFRRHWKECQVQGWFRLNQCDIDNRNNVEEEDIQSNFDN